MNYEGGNRINYQVLALAVLAQAVHDAGFRCPKTRSIQKHLLLLEELRSWCNSDNFVFWCGCANLEGQLVKAAMCEAVVGQFAQ